MSHQAHPYGSPVTILGFKENSRLKLEDAALKNLLLNPLVKDRKAVVVSIIGAFRKGKSFFLDYCLRYLYANYPSVNNPSKKEVGLFAQQDWMGEANAPLQGFSWKSGTKRNTTGVVFWSDVFLYTHEKTGERLAILLMDTQGLFDNETSPTENSRIFALGTLISSLQIFNLFNIIQEDHLQYLQFATEFARFAANERTAAGKPFQNLTFLIRDWNNPDDYEFGLEGGKQYLKKVLKVMPTQKEDLKAVRESIDSSFEQVSCCLMPHPGNDVATKKNYDGRWSKMDDDFRTELEIIIPKLLHSDGLITKKVNNEDVKCFELKSFIEAYFLAFETNQVPETKSIYELTVEKHMNILVEEGMEKYKELIFKMQDIVTEQTIATVHADVKKTVIELFDNAKKMARPQDVGKYRSKLVQQIEAKYKEWSVITAENLKELARVKAIADAAIAEQLRIEELARQAQANAERSLRELEESVRQGQIQQAKYLQDKAIYEQRLRNEIERNNQIEEQRRREQEQQRRIQERLRQQQIEINRNRSLRRAK